MIWPFKKTTTPEAPLYAVYSAIVAQSRHPAFYTDWSVPDTVTGRFDMICLHMCLVFRRLRTSSGGSPQFAQDLFDLFFRDMDRSLREMGVGDLSVPKRIQKMGGIFYGVLEKTSEALDAGDREALADVIDRNVFDGGNRGTAARMADYMMAQAARLEKQDAAGIESGKIDLRSAP